METFSILEEKIKTLVSAVKKLQDEKSTLSNDYVSLKVLHDALKAENTTLVEEVAQLHEQLKEKELLFAKENKELEQLNEERKLTKLAVDDLIKSINVLVDNEQAV